MNLVYIENAPGSGQTIIVSEAFETCVVSHRLEPGDSTRIAISRFKSIVIDDVTLAAAGLSGLAGRRETSSPRQDASGRPARPHRRREGGRTSAYRLCRPTRNETGASDQSPYSKDEGIPPLSK
jgi:hypothetical protein